jgi:hypothetical protein
MRLPSCMHCFVRQTTVKHMLSEPKAVHGCVCVCACNNRAGCVCVSFMYKMSLRKASGQQFHGGVLPRLAPSGMFSLSMVPLTNGCGE